jgi:hypothetical protein
MIKDARVLLYGVFGHREVTLIVVYRERVFFYSILIIIKYKLNGGQSPYL